MFEVRARVCAEKNYCDSKSKRNSRALAPFQFYVCSSTTRQNPNLLSIPAKCQLQAVAQEHEHPNANRGGCETLDLRACAALNCNFTGTKFTAAVAN